ncbi:MAG: PEGA domain-containing protein [Deltaproteobacteria bacterium]|nr:MAG: PEGA domain-containing protein [Deltaproteobacteria bacterium]
MKKIICWLMILLLLPVNTFAQIEDRPYIAVLDLEVKKGVPQEASTLLSDRLRMELLTTKKFKVLDRKNMDVILKEQGFQLLGCTTSECIVEVGQLLGVENIVTGNIGKLGETYYISVSMSNVETGEVERMADEEYTGEIDQLFAVMARVARELAGEEIAVAKEVAGGLQVTSSPPGALIILDGKEMGTTPIKLDNIKVGEHTLRVKNEGYADWARKVNIKPDRIVSAKVTLVPIETEPAEEEPEKKKSWYKKWWVWLLVAGAVGGGTAGAVIAAGGDEGGEESNTGSATVRW